MNPHTITLAAIVLLAGCSAAPAPTPTPVATPSPTATPASSPTPTPASTPTPTPPPSPSPSPTPTATPTPTRTPTPTPTPTPAHDRVYVGTWGETTVDGVDVRFRVRGYTVHEALDGGHLEAPDGNRWVVAEVDVEADEPLSIGYDQVKYVDVTGRVVTPDDAAMRRISLAYPDDAELDSETHEYYRVLWATEYWRDVRIVFEALAGQSGGSVTVVTR